jgi:hypothetical protein
MERTSNPGFGHVTTLMRWIDARVRLPLIGLAAGALAGVAYTLGSAPHMVLPNPADIYGVGALLTILGAAAGWLSGAMLRAPLLTGAGGSNSEAASEGNATTRTRGADTPAVRDTAARDTRRV